MAIHMHTMYVRVDLRYRRSMLISPNSEFCMIQNFQAKADKPDHKTIS